MYFYGSSILQTVVVAMYVVVLASGLLCDSVVCCTQFVHENFANSNVQIVQNLNTEIM